MKRTEEQDRAIQIASDLFLRRLSLPRFETSAVKEFGGTLV